MDCAAADDEEEGDDDEKSEQGIHVVHEVCALAWVFVNVAPARQTFAHFYYFLLGV